MNVFHKIAMLSLGLSLPTLALFRSNGCFLLLLEPPFSNSATSSALSSSRSLFAHAPSPPPSLCFHRRQRQRQFLYVFVFFSCRCISVTFSDSALGPHSLSPKKTVGAQTTTTRAGNYLFKSIKFLCPGIWRFSVIISGADWVNPYILEDIYIDRYILFAAAVGRPTPVKIAKQWKLYNHWLRIRNNQFLVALAFRRISRFGFGISWLRPAGYAAFYLLHNFGYWSQFGYIFRGFHYIYRWPLCSLRVIESECFRLLRSQRRMRAMPGHEFFIIGHPY